MFVSTVQVLTKNVFTFICMVIGLSVVGTTAHSCPAFLPAKQLSLPKGAKRHHLRLFVIDTERNVRVWRDIPVQVDPLTEEGSLRVGEQSLAEKADIEPTDRIAMRVEDFRPAKSSSDTFPCGSKQLVEVSDPSRKNAFAYLAVCSDGAPNVTKKVSYDAKASLVTSPAYRYEFKPKNQLMFKKIDLVDGQNLINAVNSSSLFLRFNVKNFLTLHFDNRNVTSMVNSTYIGPLAAIANYSFTLKILFFNFDLKMDTSVSFFEDSALIPLQFKAPIAGVLNRGSGSFYWWNKGKDLKLDAVGSDKTLPMADPNLILNDPVALAQKGLSYCKKECIYSLTGTADGKAFTIYMNVPRYLVEVGFFPQFVKDVSAFEKEAQWPEESVLDSKDSVGIFFDTTLVPSGEHRVEQWLRTGKDSKGSCPKDIIHRPLKA